MPYRGDADFAETVTLNKVEATCDSSNSTLKSLAIPPFSAWYFGHPHFTRPLNASSLLLRVSACAFAFIC